MRTLWLLVCAASVAVFAANPVVNNIRAQQRDGAKLVDIWYDVADADGDRLSVAVEVSTNDGVTFNLPASSFTGTGYGSGIVPGNGKQIVWDAGADWDGNVAANVRFRITASDTGGGPPTDGMVPIPAGLFTMGDTFSEGWSDEIPTHSVYVSAFYMDKTEVTKAKWDEVYTWAVAHGYSFSAGAGKAANHPVQTVSWYDCVKWCNARSEKEGKTPCYYLSSTFTPANLYTNGSFDISAAWVNWSANGYRLPTEAEWEKAARGGLNGRRFPWNDLNITHTNANYYSDAGYSYDTSITRGYHPTFYGTYPYTSPVGYFAANGYGLYDMAGNVWEWCWDWYDGSWYSNGSATQTDTSGPTSSPYSYRVVRGGGWAYSSFGCRVASRYFDSPDFSFDFIGFRAVRR